MSQNISKYVALDDFTLLEYEFNKDGVDTMDLSSLGGTVALTNLGTKLFFNNNSGYSLGDTNNVLSFNSTPLNAQRTSWYVNYDDDTTYYTFFNSWDASIGVHTAAYPVDTLRLHLVSGYNYDDIEGFRISIRAKDASNNLVDLSNFTYIKQPQALASADVVKFDTNALHLGNKFYDKYVEFKIPSIQNLGGDNITYIGQSLNIAQLSDVYIDYSPITVINNWQYVTSINTTLQLPVTSVGDNFNCLISESTSGDFIEFYATWVDQIIGSYIGDIESGRIRLYNSNNPNDSYQDFVDVYGTGARKWVLIHEISVYENLPSLTGGTSLLTQKYSFTQEDNFSNPNYFRPVLRTADIDATFSINYVCRLMNRMDGTQIIRKASFASTNPKKYGRYMTRINLDNIIPYKVFNRLEAEATNVVQGSNLEKVKYVKVYYDTTGVLIDELNNVFPQGTGPLFLKNNDSVYKFKFERSNSTTGERTNVDLSGAFQYSLHFTLDDNTIIDVGCTFSNNMNTTIGELEFKLMSDQINKLLSQVGNQYQINIKNPDGTSYTFYQGQYFSYNNLNTVLTNFSSITNISDLNSQITSLQIQLKSLQDQNATLQSK